MSSNPNDGATERFGIRHGLEQRGQPQDRRMDRRLRNDLWNVFYMHWPYDYEVRAKIWADWAEMTLDELDWEERRGRHTPNLNNVLLAIKKKCWGFPENHHYKIYELVEVACGGLGASRQRDFAADINSKLAENLSVCGLTKGRLERTMPALEHDSVKRASRIFPKNREHIEKALKHMGTTGPDYEASISESVKMVEHTAQKLAGKASGLNNLVKSVSKRLILHPVMQGQFAQGRIRDGPPARGHAPTSDPNRSIRWPRRAADGGRGNGFGNRIWERTGAQVAGACHGALGSREAPMLPSRP